MRWSRKHEDSLSPFTRWIGFSFIIWSRHLLIFRKVSEDTYMWKFGGEWFSVSMALKRFKISLLMQLWHSQVWCYFHKKRFQFSPAREQAEKISDFGLKAHGYLKNIHSIRSQCWWKSDFLWVHNRATGINLNAKILQNY